MTLSALEYIYNFHDCDMLPPIKREGDNMIVAFSLAKHLQYDELKEKYRDILRDREYEIVVSVCFENCTELQACEERYPDKKELFKKRGSLTKKEILFSEFDWNLDFLSVTMAQDEENKIAFSFANATKNAYINFCMSDVVVLKEEIVDQATYEAMLDNQQYG